MTHPHVGDFDGDTINHNYDLDYDYGIYYSQIANESVHRIKEAKTFEEKCELVTQLADISKRQMRNMSYRRKKLTVKRYSNLSGYYDTTTGILVSNAKSRYKNIKMIPLILRFEEKVSKPMSNFLDAWIKTL
jgi:hypothetical protein